MDPEKPNQNQKEQANPKPNMILDKLNNDDEESYDEIYSDESDQEQPQNYSKPKNTGYPIEEEEEKWDDSPEREQGQSMTLEAMDESQPEWDKEDANQQGQKKQQQIKKQDPKQEEINEVVVNEEQNQSKNKQKKRAYKQKQKKKKGYQEKPDLKCVTTPYDSKFVFAAFFLLRDELKDIAKRNQCLLKLNPYECSKNIKVYSHDEKKCQEVADKIDQSINDVQVIELGKFEAESGIQFSYKYLQLLMKQKITFFKDNTHNYKTSSYYICGKVSNKVLYQKISQIKNTHFSWIHMFKYQNTRSYRAILRKIFDTPQIHAFVLEKFKAKQIEVGCLKRDFPYTVKQNKRGVLVLLTYHGEKKLTLHQQIDHALTNFIRETFAVFCFIFSRKKQSFVNNYTPKVDKVAMFFISDKAIKYRTNYVYIIVRKIDFNEIREAIIKEIENMNIVIRGRRYFRNIHPGRETFGDQSNHKVFQFPRAYPYSWSIKPKQESQFNWKESFKI